MLFGDGGLCKRARMSMLQVNSVVTLEICFQPPSEGDRHEGISSVKKLRYFYRIDRDRQEGLPSGSIVLDSANFFGLSSKVYCSIRSGPSLVKASSIKMHQDKNKCEASVGVSRFMCVQL